MYPAPAFERKICTPDKLATELDLLPQPVVFTNGCFDVLHRGHVTYLAQARELGAALIVGVNSDASVRRQGKGADRPINNEQDRMMVLAALHLHLLTSPQKVQKNYPPCRWVILSRKKNCWKHVLK